MPEHLRAFLVVSGLMALAYVLAKRMFSSVVEPGFIGRLFATGYAATAALFLAHNMWLFLGVLALLCVLQVKRFTHPLALFVFLLLLLPGYSVQVPGFGLINYLINLKTWQVMSVVLLLPAAVHLATNPTLPRPGKLFVDNLVMAYALYTAVLNYVHYNTFTGGIRSFTESVLSSVLIYFVASRSLMLKGAVRHVMVALVAASLFLALVGTFEFAKKWILYSYTAEVLGVKGYFLLSGYHVRGDTLRASASTGQAIVLGFMMMVALLVTVYVQHLVQRGIMRTFLWVLMGLGLVAAMSRGPWVGAAIGLFVTALASANPVGNMLKLLLAAFGTAVTLVMLPGGENILDYLPWVGSIDAGGIEFREILWQQSILVINKSPWIGLIDFTEMQEFDVIRIGGFVDIVNSYLGVALQYGMIGLVLFVLILLSSVAKVVLGLSTHGKNSGEMSIYGVALLAALVATIVEIWMVSSINQIGPIVTFTVGASVAYGYLAKATRVQRRTQSTTSMVLLRERT